MSLTPVQIVESGVASVSGGQDHSLFVKTDGSLWAIGSNGHGQLGNGTTADSLVPVQIVASGVASASAGRSHSLFVKTDGSLWAMGYNKFGQLGTGAMTDVLSPVQILASGVASVSAGGDHSLDPQDRRQSVGHGLQQERPDRQRKQGRCPRADTASFPAVLHPFREDWFTR